MSQYAVAPGRTLVTAATVVPGLPNSPPVVIERHITAGETVELSPDEAEHLLTAGFITAPGTTPSVAIAPPKLAADFDLAENGRPAVRKVANS